MSKKTALFVLFLVWKFVVCPAQLIHFSMGTGSYEVDTLHGSGLENQLALRLPDGTIGVVSRGEANALMLRIYGREGDLLRAYSDRSENPFAFHYVYGAQLTPDQSAIVISGSCFDKDGNYLFFLARMQLATKETMVATFPATVSYTSAPSVSMDDGGIYVVYPMRKFSVAAKYSHLLDPLWAKAFFPQGADTSSTGHPGMGGYLADTTFVVFGKDQNQLLLTRISAATGAPLGALHFPQSGYTRIYTATRLKEGNIVLAGMQDSEPFLMKCSPSGDSVFWARKMRSDTHPFFSYEGAVELVDGRLIALGSANMGSMSFSGLSTFDADGNLLHTRLLNLPDGNFYQMGALVVDEHGMLAAGSMTKDWVSLQGVLQYTDFDLSQACEVGPVELVALDHEMGTPTEQHRFMDIWDVPAPGVSHHLTLKATDHPQPLICNLTITPLRHVPTTVRAYPNPVQGVPVQLSFSHEGNFQISLADATGRVLLSQVVTGNSHTLSTDGLGVGIYQLRVTDSDGLLHIKRLFVR